MSVTAPPIPFKGLAPFEDSDIDALLFFGRERERGLIVANLLASRLTVLYGPSGVGKSSLLRAGVAHRLRSEVRADGHPEYAVIVFDTWAADPIAELRAAVRDVLSKHDGVFDEGGSLAEDLAHWTSQLDIDVLLVLDQVEEYFVYHEREDGRGTFPGELPALVTDPALRVSVLLAIRDDSLARLDRFKGRIPNLFSNYLRLDHLDRDAARAAIVGPIDRYNRMAGENVQVEPGLVDAVLDQTAAGQVDLGTRGRGGVGTSQRIEPPYLQLVMRRLWEEEAAQGSTTLRLRTLEQIGGADEIVRSHLERALGELEPREQDLAASVFRHLVTPSGMKIAHAIPDLAEYADVDERQLRPVVSKLVDERILRPLAPRGDGRDGVPHEIYHDVLGEAVLAWRTRHETERRVEEERERARRRHQRLLAIGIIGLVAFAVMTAIAVYALAQRSDARKAARVARERETEARARAYDARAFANLGVNPQASLRDAYRAARLLPGPQEEDTLLRALIASRLLDVIHVGAVVVAAEYSSDGKRILVAGKDRDVRVYDAKRRTLLHRFGTQLRVRTAKFSPNARYVLAAGKNHRATLYNAETGKPILSVRHGAGVRSISFNRDGSRFATGGGTLVRVWRTRDGARLASFDLPHQVGDAVLSRDGRVVATRTSDRFVRVYDVDGNVPMHTLDAGGRVHSVTFTPSGAAIVAGSEDRWAHVWFTSSGVQRYVLRGHTGWVLDAVVDPRAKKIATVSTDADARMWEIGHGRMIAQLPGHTHNITGATFSPDGFSLVTWSTDGTARVWKPKGGEARAVLTGHRAPVTHAAFSPNGSRVITGSEDRTARIWDAQLEPPLRLLADLQSPVNQLVRSRDGAVLAAATDRGAWILSADGRRLRRLRLRGAAVAVAFSRDGRSVAAVYRGRAVIFDVASGRERLRLGARDVTSIDFGSGGMVATADRDGRVQLWDEAGRRTRTIVVSKKPLTRVRFDVTGGKLAIASTDRTGRIFTVEGTALETLRGHKKTVRSAALRPDGRAAVTAGDDRHGYVWNLSTKRPPIDLPRHFGPVYDVQYSPDGRWIVTAGPEAAALWSRNGTFVFFLRGHTEQLTSAFFAPDSRRIFTASRDGTVRTYVCGICGRLPALLQLARKRLAAAR